MICCLPSLYSPRTGTPAASYEDNATPQDKQRRFERLLKAQDEIVAEKQAAYQGRKLRLLVDGNAKGPEYPFTARTEGNLLVCVRGDDIKIGEFIEAEIEKPRFAVCLHTNYKKEVRTWLN